MYLYGASGHAKVIIDILKAVHEPIDGLFDDNEAVKDLLGNPVFRGEPKSPLIIAIGSNEIRKKIVSKLVSKIEYGKAIHPISIVSEMASVGEGSVIMQGAIVQSCANIGKHCIVNTGASVDHDCVVGDFCHISPHATLCGNVSLGEGVWIGVSLLLGKVYQ